MKKIELKAKTVEKKVVPVTLPEGKFAYFCCADCDYIDKSETNSYGDFWCGHYRKWVSGGDSGCTYGKENSRR